MVSPNLPEIGSWPWVAVDIFVLLAVGLTVLSVRGFWYSSVVSVLVSVVLVVFLSASVLLFSPQTSLAAPDAMELIVSMVAGW